jgi:hypothetical protein
MKKKMKERKEIPIIHEYLYINIHRRTSTQNKSRGTFVSNITTVSSHILLFSFLLFFDSFLSLLLLACNIGNYSTVHS